MRRGCRWHSTSDSLAIPRVDAEGLRNCESAGRAISESISLRVCFTVSSCIGKLGAAFFIPHGETIRATFSPDNNMILFTRSSEKRSVIVEPSRCRRSGGQQLSESHASPFHAIADDHGCLRHTDLNR